jgi:hypothetical protein
MVNAAFHRRQFAGWHKPRWRAGTMRGNGARIGGCIEWTPRMSFDSGIQMPKITQNQTIIPFPPGEH